MSEVKEQKIVVLLSLKTADKNLILNGIKIASIFRKELCLCINLKEKEKKDKEKYKSLLTSYLAPIKNELPQLRVSTLLLNEKLSELPEKLADDFEGIIVVVPATEYSKYSGSLAESPVPFLFVDGNAGQIPEYKKLVLPVDMRAENKESGIWCSYFGRYNEAAIVVVAANDSGNDDQKHVKLNVAYIKKLFQKFKIEHKIFRGTKSSLSNSFEALDLSISANSDLLVILGSSVITPIDQLIGLPEKKIIKRAGKLPVMVINPRKDNYILCD